MTAVKFGAIVLVVYLAAMVGFGVARATTQPRYDRFVSHRSGNVVRIPARCWAEDSLYHLYTADYAPGVLTLHCHHKGY